MIKITIIDNKTKIETEELELFIEGRFEIIKKEQTECTSECSITNNKIISVPLKKGKLEF